MIRATEYNIIAMDIQGCLHHPHIGQYSSH